MSKRNSSCIGSRRHPVVFERRVRTPDGLGGFTETWKPDPPSPVYCKMQFLTGTERWESLRNKNGNLIRLEMAFRGNTEGAPYWETGTHRAVFRGRIYDILAVSDVNWERKDIKMDIFEGGLS